MLISLEDFNLRSERKGRGKRSEKGTGEGAQEVGYFSVTPQIFKGWSVKLHLSNFTNQIPCSQSPVSISQEMKKYLQPSKSCGIEMSSEVKRGQKSNENNPNENCRLYSISLRVKYGSGKFLSCVSLFKPSKRAGFQNGLALNAKLSSIGLNAENSEQL